MSGPGVEQKSIMLERDFPFQLVAHSSGPTSGGGWRSPSLHSRLIFQQYFNSIHLIFSTVQCWGDNIRIMRVVGEGLGGARLDMDRGWHGGGDPHAVTLLGLAPVTSSQPG